MNHPLAALFDQFLKERLYMKNVTDRTLVCCRRLSETARRSDKGSSVNSVGPGTALMRTILRTNLPSSSSSSILNVVIFRVRRRNTSAYVHRVGGQPAVVGAGSAVDARAARIGGPDRSSL